ncbi:MAG: leucyl aminopeptidase family protein [Rhodospirillaceae bacterium]|nr:MAG: leucyl aminopeptidase family protein [Rhodospirillaceae bacterium]
MSALSVLTDADDGVPIRAVAADGLAAWVAGQPARIANWVSATGFKADGGATLLLAGPDGALELVLLGLGRGDDPWATGGLAKTLPKGRYRLVEVIGLAPALESQFSTWAALAWALGAYQFARYRKEAVAADRLAVLKWPDKCDRDYVTRAVTAAVLTRDLINTPAADMLPDALASAAADVAARHKASFRVTVGEDLLAGGYPLIHAVGRAGAVAPRLIDFAWGAPDRPKVTLVGKGVCFDTGGLDLKPASGMALMKKDMGGAATVLGLAQMIMAANLPVRLRVLIPAVENAVAGNAFRPGDVLASRHGLSVEIGNTDAEGRLVLADALSDAAAEKPALLIDCATLTGAARTALGPDLPALFTDDEALAAEFIQAARAAHDPVWRLPLWKPYRKMIDSKIADINNAGDSPFAGAITAALFLKEFVGADTPWAHLDLYAWNPSDRPGRPHGGEALAQRAMYELVARRFGGR